MVPNNHIMFELTDQKWNEMCHIDSKKIRYFLYRINILKEHIEAKSKTFKLLQMQRSWT